MKFQVHCLRCGVRLAWVRSAEEGREIIDHHLEVRHGTGEWEAWLREHPEDRRFYAEHGERFRTEIQGTVAYAVFQIIYKLRKAFSDTRRES